MKKILENLAWELAQYNQFPMAIEAKERVEAAIGSSISSSLEAAQLAERTLKIIQSGASTNIDLIKTLEKTKDPLWSADPDINIGDEEAYAIAMQFYKSNQQGKSKNWGQSSVLKASHIGKKIIENVVKIFEENGKTFDAIEFDEWYFHTALIAWTWEAGFDALKTRRLQKFSSASKLVNIRQNPPGALKDMFDEETLKRLKSYIPTWTDRLATGDLFYTLTVIPTPEDAEAIGMPYADYVKLYLEACDQPWEEIGKAHEALIEKFDKAKQLHITNEDGTDITMSIDGMTFANSLVLKNIPWSEIFSAPVRDSVNGTIVSKGVFKYKDSPIVMKDITLKVENGKIIEWFAVEWNEELQRLISQPWADHFGEIWIGTNPHLQQQFLDWLLVEKVGWSFHMAVWAAYEYKEYDGNPVNLDNWSRSDIHWDLTTMLRGKESKMTLDGEIIQKNGKWLDAKLKVLNEWWGALDTEKQPDRWKERYPQGYASAANI